MTTIRTIIHPQTWIESLRYANWKNNVKIHEDRGTGGNRTTTRFSIFTDNNEYAITFSHNYHTGDSYVGCIARSRKPRAGEDWTRGNDLPDGPAIQETWDIITRAIIGYELVNVVKEARENKLDLPEYETDRYQQTHAEDLFYEGLIKAQPETITFPNSACALH